MFAAHRSRRNRDVPVIADAPFWSGPQLAGNWDVIWYYTLQHVRYTVIAVALGTLVSLPLAYLSVRRPATYPVILSVTNVDLRHPVARPVRAAGAGARLSPTTSRSSSPWRCTRS